MKLSEEIRQDGRQEDHQAWFERVAERVEKLEIALEEILDAYQDQAIWPDMKIILRSQAALN
jgi:hypothetical protein